MTESKCIDLLSKIN